MEISGIAMFPVNSLPILHLYIGVVRGLYLWCSSIRKAYKKVQKGEKTDHDISQDRIERLEKIGFKWKGIDHDEAFETRCSELDAFKSKFVHFTTFPVQYSTNTSLGYWYDNMRSAYSKRYREERNCITISLKIGWINHKR